MIDLSRHLNALEIDPDPENKFAYVGGGAIWEQVDSKASILRGLASVAGTVNHVCCTTQASI